VAERPRTRAEGTERPVRVRGGWIRLKVGWNWALLFGAFAAVCFALPFASAFGKFAADTRAAVFFSPGQYLHGALSVWQPNPSLGVEQHDGLLFPMAVVIAALRFLGGAPWVVERLWHGLLLFTAAMGMVVLVRVLRPGPLSVAHPVAAAAYAFNPFSLGAALHGSGAYLTYFVLPLLLAAFVWGLRSPRSWLGPALVALAAFLMGGGNGASQVYAVVPCLAYLVWAVWARRSITLREGLVFGLRALLLAVAVNLWWLIGLTGGQIGNDITFSEQPRVINVASSYSESLRLLGFWGFYGGDQAGPWYPTLVSFITTPFLVVTTFVTPLAALFVAWRSRWRDRLLFVLLAILAVVVMAGIFPVGSPRPFGRFLLWAYDRVPGAVGLRTTYKIGALLALSIALLLGIGLEELGRRVRPALRLAAVAVVGAVVAANAFPLWTGSLYPSFRTVRALPSYWSQALTALEAAPAGERAWFVPGSLQAYYRWGGLVGGIPDLYPDLNAVRRPGVMVGAHYMNDLLAALEQPFQHGPDDPASTAPLLRYLGVRSVVLQNDLDWERSQTARPADLQVLTSQAGLGSFSNYGLPGQNVLGPSPGPRPPDIRIRFQELGLTPVQVLNVQAPLAPVQASSRPPVIVSGDGFALPILASIGALDGRPPILYSGALSTSDLEQALRDGGSLVISDSNRRRVWRIGAMRDNFTATAPAGDDLGGERPGFALFGNRADTETVARYAGARSITASAYGSIFVDQPEFRPALAFDGNPATAWLTGGFSQAVGQWIRVDFRHPVPVDRIRLAPRLVPTGARQITRALVLFSDGSQIPVDLRSVSAANPSVVVTFPRREVRWVRVDILKVKNPQNASLVGFDEISVAGVHPREALRLPVDVVDAASSDPALDSLVDRAPLTYLFTRARSDTPEPDEEQGLQRLFDVPSTRSFELAGSVHLDPRAPDDAIDQLVYGTTRDDATSSGRWLGNPGWRASRAFDGNPFTSWIPPATGQPWIQIHFPLREVSKLRVVPVVNKRRSFLTRVSLKFSDGSSIDDLVLPGGKPTTFTFPPRLVDSVRLTVTQVLLRPAGKNGKAPKPVAIAEVQGLGQRYPASPKPSSRPACYRGSGFQLDDSPVDVQVDGTVGSLLAGKSLGIHLCKGSSASLDAGTHMLAASGVLQPDLLRLRSAGSGPSVGPSASPRLSFEHPSAGRYVIHVQNSQRPFYLSIGENWSTGWRASAGGTSLGTPLVLDGYAAGWRIDRSGSFDVLVSYAPQGRQTLAFLLTAVSLAAVLIVAVVGLRRRHRTLRGAGRPGEDPAP
jgi:arabinofuranan 3-O-arabinosyltransferase